MSDQKKFIYFPSFSSKASLLKKDDFKLGDLKTIRFYDDKYPKEFQHKFFLLTAAGFYKQKTSIREELGMKDILVLGDSGGFQIANGTIKWDNTIVEKIFNWLEENSDIAMNLDIPPRLLYKGKSNECLELSYNNFKYFEKHQTGKTKFLNVLQIDAKGEDGIDKWFSTVRDFQFNGWSVGSSTIQYIVYCLARLLTDREFEKKNFEYLHFLGTSSPFHFLLYAAMQKGCNRYFPHCTITTDSSTPLMQGVFGNWYHSLNYDKLAWKQLDFGNKGRTKYMDEEKLPCILKCPICENIKFKEINDYGLLANYMVYVGWHNLAIYKHGLEQVSDLVYAQKSKEHKNDKGGVLESFFTGTLLGKNILFLLAIIDNMFADPDKARNIYLENKKLLVDISKVLEEGIDHKVKNDPELFAAD